MRTVFERAAEVSHLSIFLPCTCCVFFRQFHGRRSAFMNVFELWEARKPERGQRSVIVNGIQTREEIIRATVLSVAARGPSVV